MSAVTSLTHCIFFFFLICLSSSTSFAFDVIEYYADFSSRCAAAPASACGSLDGDERYVACTAEVKELRGGEGGP